MKVLFLDVDDVLNNHYTKDIILMPDGKPYWVPGSNPKVAWTGVDEYRVEFIRTIVKKTKCKIVLGTSWRNDEIAVAYLRKRLGEETARQITGSTPDSKGRVSRAEEIDN